MNAAGDGTRPLDPHMIKDLIPSHIASRVELLRWEQDNCNEALAWAEKRRPDNLLTEAFLRQFHRRMFCHTWRWAGKYRRTDPSGIVCSTS